MLKFSNYFSLLFEKTRNLPFVHFTVDELVYSDGRSKSTGVIESFRTRGVKENTSAVKIDPKNIKESLSLAFDNAYHHSVRLNRTNLRNIDIKKPRKAIGAAILIEDVGQVLPNSTLDFDNHVFLGATGPDSIVGIIKFNDLIPSEVPTNKSFSSLSDFSFNVDNHSNEIEKIKNKFIEEYFKNVNNR